MTESFDTKLNNHYGKIDIVTKVLEQFKRKNIDINKITRKDLEFMEEFHIGGRVATRDMAEFAKIPAGAKVLDIGCGVGGPARTLTDEFSCEVIGVDVTPQFIDAAIKLSELVGMGDKMQFLVGNATKQLSFESKTFDYVWLQHVTMNIEDKQNLFYEIKRLLKDTGKLVFYEVIKGNDQELDFPVLWSPSQELSFLINEKAYKSLLQNAGLVEEVFEDRSDFAQNWFQKLLKDPANSSSKRENVLKALNENSIRVVRAIYSTAN